MITNFAFVMDLLKIPAKKFSERGFDKTQVSRWRNGKIRLMPKRYIVKSISELFWSVDAESACPVLKEILNIWYPTDFCNTETEKHAVLEKFLTEKEQFREDYELLREKRLGKLSDDENSVFISSHGIESAKLRLLDFLDLVLDLPPTQIDTVYPCGREVLLYDAEFNALINEKFLMLFDKGHTMLSVIRSDEAVSQFAYSYNNNLIHLLNGYIRNQYFNDFSVNTPELFLAVADDLIALEVIENEPGNIESIVGIIHTDKEHINNIKARIKSYLDRSSTREHFDFFNKPDNYLKHVHISLDSPCYIFTRLPHFGIVSTEKFSNAFSLSKIEMEVINQEINPFTLSPSSFWEYSTVHHIFCENDIENALLKKRHQSFELSRILKRRVWMTTSDLIRQLIEIKKQLKTCKNYDVCFLNDEYFNGLKIQLAVWGYGASITWIDSMHSTSSRGYVIQRIIQGFCHTVWSDIPDRLKNRKCSIRKIDQWLEKAKKYGYIIDEY